MSIVSTTDIAGKNVAPYLTAVVPARGAVADSSRPRLADEDVRRQDRGREVVRRVDDLTDTEVDGDARDRVGLLPRVAVLVHQVVEHVPQGVARRGREVVGGPARRGVGAEAGRRERRARRGVRGRDGDLEPPLAQPPLCRLPPAENSAPSCQTGNRIRVPATICRTSMLPPFSRGGFVRRPRLAIGSVAGTAPRASGSTTSSPRSVIARSRREISSNSSCDGATPIVPTNGDPGIRTRGRSGEVAQPSASSHRTRNGSGNSSARNPNPGISAVYPNVGGTISRTSP